LRHAALRHTELLGQGLLLEPGGIERLLQQPHYLAGEAGGGQPLGTDIRSFLILD
jgi:hypothetical protein